MVEIIKVKSPNYTGCIMGYFTATALIIAGVLMATVSQNHLVFMWGICFMLPVAAIILCPSIIFWFVCNIYDIFTENGIKRVYKDKTICETTWDNVYSVTYRSSPLWIPALVFMSAYTLSVESIKVLQIEFRYPIHYADSIEHKWETHILRPDNKNMMYTYISRKNMKRILPFIQSSTRKFLPKKYKNIIADSKTMGAICNQNKN